MTSSLAVAPFCNRNSTEKKPPQFKLHSYTMDCVDFQSNLAKLGAVKLGPTVGWIRWLFFVLLGRTRFAWLERAFRHFFITTLLKFIFSRTDFLSSVLLLYLFVQYSVWGWMSRWLVSFTRFLLQVFNQHRQLVRSQLIL